MLTSPFRVGDRVRCADTEKMRDFRGTVTGFENVVRRSGVDEVIAAAATSARGEQADHFVDQLVVVTLEDGVVATFHPSWLAREETP